MTTNVIQRKTDLKEIADWCSGRAYSDNAPLDDYVKGYQDAMEEAASHCLALMDRMWTA